MDVVQRSQRAVDGNSSLGLCMIRHGARPRVRNVKIDGAKIPDGGIRSAINTVDLSEAETMLQ